MPEPETLLERFYPDYDLRPLAEKYDFDPADVGIRHLLAKGLRYLTRHESIKENRDPELLKSKKAHLKKALSHFDRMTISLKDADAWDGMVYLEDLLKLLRINVAYSEKDRPPPTIKSEEVFFNKALPIYRELLVQKIESINLPKGRPRNVGLQDFTDYMYDIWSRELKRPFTIDYHKGTGTTLAFEFVKDMLLPFEQPTDVEIINAMRFVISERSIHNK